MRRSGERRRLARRGRAGAWAAAAIMLACASAGCSTIRQLGPLGPQIIFGALETILLNNFVTPTLVADAGADRFVLTNERIVLSGESSFLQSGSGAQQPLPGNTAFNWQIVGGPPLDADGNPIPYPVQQAAGIRLDLPTSTTPQFVSSVAGQFAIQLTLTATADNGAPLSSNSSVVVTVAAPAP